MSDTTKIEPSITRNEARSLCVAIIRPEKQDDVKQIDRCNQKMAEFRDSFVKSTKKDGFKALCSTRIEKEGFYSNYLVSFETVCVDDRPPLDF